MEPFIEAILLTIAVSSCLAMISHIYYLVVLNGSELPVHPYSFFRKRSKERSKEQRVKEKLNEFKAVSLTDRKPVLGQALVFSLYIILILMLFFNLIFLAAITSGSMQPTFERGDLVAMQKISTTPEVGDIIMFDCKDSLLPVTHRVVAVTESGVRTQGDANGIPDPWIVSEETIQAKVVQLGGTPVVIKDVGDYFILDTSEMQYGKYGLEYSFIKNVFSTMRLYGYALCILAILGYLWLTVKERR